MGGQQSRQKHVALDDPESKYVIPQNTHKIKGLSRYMSAKADHDRIVATRGWDKHDENMQSMQMLKGLFKNLDPTVMKAVGDIRGDIQLSFKYDFKRQLLLIKVIRCRELPSKDWRSKMSDPYVMVRLLPDTNRQGEKKTRVVQQCNNPTYNEIFAFQLDELELMDMKLLVQVLDKDIISRDDVIGEVIIDMNTFKFKENPVHTAWYMLNKETDLSITGEIDITVAFQMPQSLFVTIHRATGLAARDEGNASDPFVKLTIPGTSVLYQTQVLKKTLNPEWEETFEFPIALEELEDRFIIFHVVDEDVSSSNDSLGQAIVDLKDFDPDRGMHGSYKLADLRNTERIRSKWFQRITAEEFSEALYAHSMSKQPSFIFQNQRTGKRVNCIVSS
ncbi:hypothetical protein KUTeg_020620 [Tegillarca granosa]|uniref:C2 domain-containing protein n=1 Tax=Tegillarca granosa TaxID=220873 RepID=A0ABQ9EEF5_TEGGR|nr:hypothetical protein KUTeg_020620 [Tegillarca granosa]